MTSVISLAEIYYKADGLNDYICDYGADDWDVQEALMGDPFCHPLSPFVLDFI